MLSADCRELEMLLEFDAMLMCCVDDLIDSERDAIRLCVSGAVSC